MFRVEAKVKRTGNILTLSEYQFGVIKDYNKYNEKIINENGETEYYKIDEFTGEIKKVDVGGRRKETNFDNLTGIEKLLYFQRKKATIKKAKQTIRDLINCNVFKYFDEKSCVISPKFLTLTFKENKKDLSDAYYELKKFFQRLNDYTSKKIKYICVPEFQDGKKRKDKKGRGAVHYHIILFNCPYIEFKQLKKIWGIGSVYIESFLKDKKIIKLKFDSETMETITEIDNVGCIVENIGAYITKCMDYMLKDISIDEIDESFFQNKMYYKSRGLIQPEVQEFLKRKDSELEKIKVELLKFDIAYYNESVTEYYGLIQYKTYILIKKYEKEELKDFDIESLNFIKLVLDFFQGTTIKEGVKRE